MQRESAVKFEGEMRVHLGLEVADLDRSIAFYRLLFDEDPVKLRPGYAKFEPRTPSVNLSLNQGVGGRMGRAGGSQHFGLQVQSSDAVQAMIVRLREAGLATRIETETTCCYAVQDKVWVEDPDGNPWEVFVVLEADAERRAPEQATCCVPESASVSAARGAEDAENTGRASGACC